MIRTTGDDRGPSLQGEQRHDKVGLGSRHVVVDKISPVHTGGLRANSIYLCWKRQGASEVV